MKEAESDLRAAEPTLVMALIIINATNSRQGGGLVFAEKVLPRLAELLAEKGHVLRVLDHSCVGGTGGGIRTVRSQFLLHGACASADLILNIGNVAVLSAGAIPQWLMIRDRSLVEPKASDATVQGLALRTRRSLLLASLAKSERWVVPSHAMGSAVLAHCERWRVAPRPMEVLPHGVREISPLTRRPIRASEPYRALYPASAYEHKNFATLIAAVRNVRAAGRDVRLTLTIERHHLSALLPGSHLPADVDAWVDCVGLVTHSVVEELYAVHDVLVFPSTCESFGMPLAEAAAQNLPVIASDLEVTREVAAQGTRFVPARSVDEWTEALRAFTTSSSCQAPNTADLPCTWDHVSGRLARSLSARVAQP